MLTQTLALFLDAYRELQAKKLFWVVMVLNVLVIGLFAILGANDHATTVLWYEPLKGGIPPITYKIIFSNGIVGFWFTWAATILALISTAGIFPDLLSSGSIDLYLSRPIGRMRLFFTKYVSGLIFVALQVGIFTLLSFVVLGWRAHLWEPGLFWAIPLVLIFFSYLYAICVLIGMVTRSTIAALMLTLLAWLGIWVVDFVDVRLQRASYDITVWHDELKDAMGGVDAQIAAERQKATPDAAQLATLQDARKEMQQRSDQLVVPEGVYTAQNVLFGIKSIVPKTRETIGLLDRVLFNDKDLQDANKAAEESAPIPGMPAPPRAARGGGLGGLFGRGGRVGGAGGRGGPNVPGAAIPRTAQIELDRQRSPWWIIGTSLLFEAGMLMVAAWLFCTRDY